MVYDPAGDYAEQLEERYRQVGIGLMGGPTGDLGVIYLYPIASARPAAQTAASPLRRPGPLSREGEGRYRWEQAPSPTRRTLAALTAALAIAQQEQRIKGARLKFFRPALGGGADFTSDTDVGGLSQPSKGSIWVRSILTASEGVRIVAHEARHMAQVVTNWPGADDARASESDAEAYAQSFWRRHGARLVAQARAWL